MVGALWRENYRALPLAATNALQLNPWLNNAKKHVRGSVYFLVVALCCDVV